MCRKLPVDITFSRFKREKLFSMIQKAPGNFTPPLLLYVYCSHSFEVGNLSDLIC